MFWKAALLGLFFTTSIWLVRWAPEGEALSYGEDAVYQVDGGGDTSDNLRKREGSNGIPPN